ncbi:MAG TPA: hypothetical protein VGD77_15105 [Gemmatimonadaceae bacterium]
MHTLSHRIPLAAGTLLAALSLASAPAPVGAQGARFAREGARATAAPAPAPALRRYGAATKVGQGAIRPYVTLDPATNEPLEIGVAFDEGALQGLPTDGAGHHGQPGAVHQYILQFPATATPFQFLEVNWNPMGHEPDGVYAGVPHFDFHFYTISQAERDAIMPSDPRWAEKANDIPTGEYVPAFNVPLGPPGAKPAAVAVPMMGVHWSDLRSPELQKLLGKPEAYQPFTATFIHGSWAGRYIFWEPMITRAHLLAKRDAADPAVRDQVLPIPVPAKYHVPGFYPDAYRITWDAEAKEYRVALTGMAKRG